MYSLSQLQSWRVTELGFNPGILSLLDPLSLKNWAGCLTGRGRLKASSRHPVPSQELKPRTDMCSCVV